MREMQKKGTILKKKTYILILLLALLTSSLFAVANAAVVDSPVDHDLFVSDDEVIINAPVDGDVFVAGGKVVINGSISGDVIVAGGQISIKQDVEGKIIAAGGTIEIEGTAEKIIAAGGNIVIHSTAVIETYARLIGGNVINSGNVTDDLVVRAGSFENLGTAGEVDYKQIEFQDYEQVEFQRFTREAGTFFAAIGVLSKIVSTIGFLVLGVLMLYLFPKQFLKVEQELTKSPFIKTLVGFALIIVTAVLTVLLAITIIGFQVAVVLGLFFVIALMTSGLFVPLVLGRRIGQTLDFKVNDIWYFVIGFTILSIIYYVPILGSIIQAATISLGFGAVFYTLRKNWSSIRSTA